MSPQSTQSSRLSAPFSSQLSSREIILANLERRGPPRPGFNFSGERLDDIVCAGVDAGIIWQPRRWTEATVEYYDDPWGNIWRRKVGGSMKGEVVVPFIVDWRQLDRLRPPAYDDPRCYGAACALFAQHPGEFKLAAVPGWVFADARYLRKMETYFLDLYQYPEELDRLHTLIADLYERVILRFAEAGADGIVFGEDLGTQVGPLLSPEVWRQYFRPHYERLTGLAHEHGMKVLMHSCGQNTMLLDDLLAAGIDCFQFDQPAVYDMPALAEKLRRAGASLWAPVDIQRVLPTGDRARIEAESARLVEIFQGGLILKDYPDLPGIGVKPEWDDWAYQTFLRVCGL